MIAARLYNPHRVPSMILVSPAEATISGRRLEAGVKADIEIGERVFIEDTQTLVIYN